MISIVTTKCLQSPDRQLHARPDFRSCHGKDTPPSSRNRRCRHTRRARANHRTPLRSFPLLWACLFVSVGLAAGCGQDDVGDRGDREFLEADGGVLEPKSPMASSDGSPIMEVVAQTFVLQDLEASLVASRALREMDSPPYTLFAPWDYALSRLPYWDKITRNRAWHGHLRDLTLGHIHEGRIPKEELRDGMTITMLNGDVGQVSTVNNRPRMDGGSIIASTAASDGYIHMLQEVREPDWAGRTVLDVIMSDERFSVLSEALNHASMAHMRDKLSANAEGVTLFAPTNEALAGLDLEQCQEPDCSALLEQLLGNHIADGVVSADFSRREDFTTESGSSLLWSASTRSITCTNADNSQQEAQLNQLDELYAINGIVQPIQQLLCTTLDQCATECTPEQQCGSIDDGCGGTVDCGFCGGGQNCVDNQCVPEDTNVSPFFQQSAYGAHEVLVFNIRCVSGNCQESKTQKMWENLSTADVEDAFFGEQPYSASSWYADCSNDHFRFTPSSYGGVIEVGLDASDVDSGDSFARQQFHEAFGQSPGDAVEHVVYCFPKHNRGPNITIAPVRDGLPSGSTVWLSHGHCVDAGFILHELGHSIGLKHAGGFQENGTVGAYSDNTDIMGGALTSPQCFNGTNLWRTGWHRDRSISLVPVEGASLDVHIATMLDRDRAADDEHFVVKLGDYYLRYNVREPNELPGMQSSQPDREMDRLVTVTRDESPANGIRSVLYAGLDVDSTYGIENFNGTDTLYVKACARFEGDETSARSMTVSIGYDESQLCDGQCVDSDGDQTSDCEDRCPSDPGKTEHGICGCGISDADTDGDGRADCMDGCPNDANKMHPLQCGCGVPEGTCGVCEDSNPTWCESSVVERGYCFGEDSYSDYVRRRCCKTCFIDLRDEW